MEEALLEAHVIDQTLREVAPDSLHPINFTDRSDRIRAPLKSTILENAPAHLHIGPPAALKFDTGQPRIVDTQEAVVDGTDQTSFNGEPFNSTHPFVVFQLTRPADLTSQRTRWSGAALHTGRPDQSRA